MKDDAGEALSSNKEGVEKLCKIAEVFLARYSENLIKYGTDPAFRDQCDKNFMDSFINLRSSKEEMNEEKRG